MKNILVNSGVNFSSWLINRYSMRNILEITFHEGQNWSLIFARWACFFFWIWSRLTNQFLMVWYLEEVFEKWLCLSYNSINVLKILYSNTSIKRNLYKTRTFLKLKYFRFPSAFAGLYLHLQVKNLSNDKNIFGSRGITFYTSSSVFQKFVLF